MRPIDADALIEVIKKSMAENPHKEEMQRAMHIHEHKYFLTLLAGIPTIQPVATDTNVGDKISRQAAIDAAKEAVIADEQPYVENALKSVPSAQQENGIGEWVTYYKYDNFIGRYEWKRCSKCGKDMISHETDYCPHCGTKMKGAQNG